jgi:hypothetical protein
MVKTFSITADVPPDRRVRIVLADDVPTGPAEIVVVVTSRTSIAHTLGGLARSKFFGMWRGRGDIGDSAEFARRLRAEAWTRAL